MRQPPNSPFSSFIILAIVFYTFFSCNNDNSSGDKKETTSDTSAIKKEESKSPEELEADLKENLANQTPLGADDLKALLPAKLSGAGQENVDFSSSTGAATATAEYKINDSTKIELTLVDCAGPAGSGFLATQYLDRIKPGTENSESRIIEFKGAKAILDSPANTTEHSLTWFTGNRYLVTVFGEKIDTEELKKMAKEIEIK